MSKNTKMFRLRWMALTLLVLPVVSGCATSRGTVELDVARSMNPAAGTAVRIVSVTDNRKFEISPSTPSTPSLKDNRIHDKALTSRAIARKRNTYGMALGDILLPEGDSVENVVRNIVTASLRDTGLRVLETNQTDYERAIPLQVEIEKFWAWFTPGFWALHLEFESQIKIVGPLAPFREGQTFTGKSRLAAQAATTGAWQKTIDKGIAELQSDITLHAR